MGVWSEQGSRSLFRGAFSVSSPPSLLIELECNYLSTFADGEVDSPVGYSTG